MRLVLLAVLVAVAACGVEGPRDYPLYEEPEAVCWRTGQDYHGDTYCGPDGGENLCELPSGEIVGGCSSPGADCKPKYRDNFDCCYEGPVYILPLKEVQDAWDGQYAADCL